MTWSMTTSTQSRWSTMDAQRKRSTLHRLSVVCPTNDNHEGPVPPGVPTGNLVRGLYIEDLASAW